MAFCSYSKEFSDNSYTNVENHFITKYMPQANDTAVKVYLYGLYLCQNSQSDFSLENCAEVLNISPDIVKESFEFWEDCDLLRIISRNPFAVEYLPVSSAVGRPKKVRYEKYADFNKEMQNHMQKVGHYVQYTESIKYMNFLQDCTMEPQALLLIADYCINKDKEKVTPSHILNKAKKMLSLGFITYEQVDEELSNYNIHENDLQTLFRVLSIRRSADEGDYALYEKWLSLGFSLPSILKTATFIKRGGMDALNDKISELSRQEKLEAQDIADYLSLQSTLSEITFKIARALSVKIASPQTYIENYVAKWYDRGFECDSLTALAVFCVKTERNSFEGMDTLLKNLYNNGIVSQASIQTFLEKENSDLKLLTKIQESCGVLRKTSLGLDMLDVWRNWNFSEQMILQAAKRAFGTTNPLAYMNKILSEWKRTNTFTVENIKDIPSTPVNTPSAYQEKINAMDEKTDRERHYALLRQRAQAKADKYIAVAESVSGYKEINTSIRLGQIALAKAEIYHPETLPDLQAKMKEMQEKRKEILSSLGIKEEYLSPQWHCKKCSDTGFLPDGRACDCYTKP